MYHHFSHPHQLQLWNLHAQLPQSLIALCSCCKLPLIEPMYVCIPCNFFLHLSCAQYPQLITHPAHKNHNLTLLPTPAYPGGAFNCDACNHQGNGFSYHCSSCEYDLHVNCASKPFTIIHQFHPCLLELTFKNPYDNAKGFSCDICHKIGFKEWLYRCSACEFDVHLDCTIGTPAPAEVHGDQAELLHGGAGSSVQNPPMGSAESHPLLRQQQHHNHHHQLTHSASMGANPMSHSQFQSENAAGPPVHGQVMRPNLFHSASTGRLQLGGNARQSGLLSSMIQGLVEGPAPGDGQGLVQGIIGGRNFGGVSGRGVGGGGLGNIFGDSSGGQN